MSLSGSGPALIFFIASFPNRPHALINDFHTGAFLVLSNSENIGKGSTFSLSSGDRGGSSGTPRFSLYLSIVQPVPRQAAAAL